MVWRVISARRDRGGNAPAWPDRAALLSEASIATATRYIGSAQLQLRNTTLKTAQVVDLQTGVGRTTAGESVCLDRKSFSNRRARKRFAFKCERTGFRSIKLFCRPQPISSVRQEHLRTTTRSWRRRLDQLPLQHRHQHPRQRQRPYLARSRRTIRVFHPVLRL